MTAATFLFLGVGGALFLGLIAYEGIGDVFGAAAAAGWGVLAVAAFHLVPMIGDTEGWRRIMPARHRLSFGSVLWIRWVGESANNLLPGAPVSGDLVRARLAMLDGMPGPVAGASVTGDLTLGALAQVAFSILGILALVRLGGAGSEGLVAGVVAGLVVMGGLIGVFLALQNVGMFRILGRVAALAARGRSWLELVGGAAALDRELAAIYARKFGLAPSMAWRMASWIAGTGEVWLGLHFIGHPIGLVEAFMIESLIQAIRAAAFVIPGGLGVQEGGFVLLGSVVGLGPEVSLALALVRRARELLHGVPGLIAWQLREGGRLLRRGRG